MSNGNGEGGPVGHEQVNTNIVTLTRFLTEEQTKHKEATGDFTLVDQTNSPMNETNTNPSDYFAMPSNSLSNQLPTTFDVHR